MSILPLDSEIAELLDARALSEMQSGGEFEPLSDCNFGEAITEAKDEQLAKVAAYLRANDHEGACAALLLICHEYWFDYAKTILESKVIEEHARAEIARKCPLILAHQAA